MAIHQHTHQFSAGLLAVLAVGVGRFQQRFDILFGDHLAEHIELILLQMTVVQQQGNGVRHRAVAQLLGDELCVVVKTVGIQQAQAGKVALLTQLFGVAVSSSTPGICSASCSMTRYSRLGACSLEPDGELHRPPADPSWRRPVAPDAACCGGRSRGSR